MLTTTTAFDAAAIATVRKPKGRITVTWSDPYVDTGVTRTAIDENNVSDLPQTTDNINYPSELWFLLDGNSILDGTTYKLFPTPTQTEYQVGWYGNLFSDSSGNFSTPQTLQISFSTKAVIGIILYGDSIRNEYPVSFTIKVRTGLSEEAIITETDNSEVYYYNIVNVPSCDNILLTVTKWSQPTAVIKIMEFYSSIIRQYNGDVIKSISVLEEREIRDSTTPIGNISANEVSIELQNIKVDGITDPFFPGNTLSFYYTLLKPGRLVNVELGFETAGGSDSFVTMGTFWSGDFTIDDKSPTMSFTARDRMERLRKLTYDDNEFETSISFETLLDNVLTSAKLKEPQLEYSIDSNLSSLTIPISYIKRVDYFEAIKQVVAACGGQAYMSRNDELIIESSNDATAYSGIDLFITKSEYFTKNQPSRYEEIINKLEIETQPLIIGTSLETVYKTDTDITLLASATNDPITIVYSSTPVSGVSDSTVTLTGTTCTPTITDSSYYSWGCILEITNSVATDGTFTIEIEGYTYELVDQKVISSQDDTSILANGEKVYRLPTNHLIQSDSLAQDIADDLIGFYADPRNDLVLTWRGNPALELGDIIVVPEYQRGAVDNQAIFKIYKLVTDFDGSLKQTISARRIDTYTP